MAIAVTLLACAGEGTDSSTTTTTLASSSSLAEIQTSIFTPKCATSPSCHNSVGLAPKLSSTSQSHGALVGVTATGCSDKIFVVAGDSAASYLVDKLGAGADDYCGSLMPLVSTALSSTEIALVEAWIDAGAPEASSKRRGTTTTSTSSTTVRSQYWND